MKMGMSILQTAATSTRGGRLLLNIFRMLTENGFEIVSSGG